MILLSVVLALSRLLMHLHYKVSNETARFQDMSKVAEAKYRKLEEYKEMLAKMVVWMELVKSMVESSGELRFTD